MDTAGEQGTSSTPIVHIGVSNFARGHWFDLVQRMGLEVTGVQINTEGVRPQLQPNDFDYDLIIKHPGCGPEIHRITALKDILFAKEDRGAVVRTLAHPDTKVVSLTITEDGYKKISTSDIQREMSKTPNAGYRTIDEPTTAAAYIAAALKIRFDLGMEPFSILPLDNHPNSGNELKALLVKYASQIGENFAEWVSGIECLEAMGDRIVSSVDKEPAHVTYLEELARTQEFLPSPMIVEPLPHTHLVLDEIRPSNEVLKLLIAIDGVESGEDVERYEMLKTRVVNSSHLAIGVMGRVLSDFDFVHEVMENPVLRRFVEDFALQMIETVPEFNGINKRDYALGVMERLSNDQLMDPLSRVSRNAFGKLPKLLIDPLNDLSGAGLPHHRIDVVVAAYIELLKIAAKAKADRVEFDLNDKAGVAGGIIDLAPSGYEKLEIITADNVADNAFGHSNDRQQLITGIEIGRRELVEIAEQVRTGYQPEPSDLRTPPRAKSVVAGVPNLPEGQGRLIDLETLDATETNQVDADLITDLRPLQGPVLPGFTL